MSIVHCYRCNAPVEVKGFVLAEFYCEACRAAKVEIVSQASVVSQPESEAPGWSSIGVLAHELGDALRPVLAKHALRGDLPKTDVLIRATFDGPGGEERPWVEVRIDPEFTRKVIARRTGP